MPNTHHKITKGIWSRSCRPPGPGCSSSWCGKWVAWCGRTVSSAGGLAWGPQLPGPGTPGCPWWGSPTTFVQPKKIQIMSIILPTIERLKIKVVICIRDMDVEGSTAITHTCSGNVLYKRCKCCVRMGWRSYGCWVTLMCPWYYHVICYLGVLKGCLVASCSAWKLWNTVVNEAIFK